MADFFRNLLGHAPLPEKLDVAIRILYAMRESEEITPEVVHAVAVIASDIKHNDNHDISALMETVKHEQRLIWNRNLGNIEPNTHKKEYRILLKMLTDLTPHLADENYSKWAKRYPVVHATLGAERALPVKTPLQKQMDLAIRVVEKMHTELTENRTMVTDDTLIYITEIIKRGDTNKLTVDEVIKQVYAMPGKVEKWETTPNIADARIYQAAGLASRMIKDKIPVDDAAREIIYFLAEKRSQGRTAPLSVANYSERLFELEHTQPSPAAYRS